MSIGVRPVRSPRPSPRPGPARRPRPGSPAAMTTATPPAIGSPERARRAALSTGSHDVHHARDGDRSEGQAEDRQARGQDRDLAGRAVDEPDDDQDRRAKEGDGHDRSEGRQQAAPLGPAQERRGRARRLGPRRLGPRRLGPGLRQAARRRARRLGHAPRVRWKTATLCSSRGRLIAAATIRPVSGKSASRSGPAASRLGKVQ